MNFKRSLFLTTLLAASASAFAQTVVDGSFENSPITSNSFVYAPLGTAWTYSYPAGLANGGSPWHDAAESGDQYGYIQSGSGAAGEMSGWITGLTAGTTYFLDFFLGSRGGYGINPLTVQVGGTAIATNVAPPDVMSGTGWTEFSLAFVAPASSTSVDFIGSPDNGGDLNTAIDNITVQSVPEPATFAALGLGALGLLIRRRSTRRG